MTADGSQSGAEDTGGASIYDADQLGPEDTLEDRGVADPLDEGYSPPERPLLVERFGNTAEETKEGESLDQRLSEEVPDPNLGEPDPVEDPHPGQDPIDREAAEINAADAEQDYDAADGGDEVGDERAGRLVAPDEGAHEDTEKDLIGSEVGIDGGASSAEEAAMHIVEE